MSDVAMSRTPLHIDGHTLFYEEHGQGEETFIFFHGVTSNLASWYGFIDPFKARGRVLLVNLPGHYPATFPDGYGEDQITAEAWGDLGGKVVAALNDGQPATLIGHSTGGFWALAIAWRAPEVVNRLISISGFAHGQWSGALGLHQRMLLRWGALYYWYFVLNYRVPAISTSVLTPTCRIYNQGLRAPYNPQAIRQSAIDILPDFRRLDMGAMAKVFRAMRDQVDMRQHLSAIKASTLAITGDADPIVPPFHAELIAERVPGATLAVVPGGHVALIESRDDVHRAILSWLDSE